MANSTFTKDDELQRLYEHLDELRHHNHILKLESEITSLEKQLGDKTHVWTSTPMPSDECLSKLKPRRLRLDIPAGRSDDTSKTDAGRQQSDISVAEHMRIDDFVTYRRKHKADSSKKVDGPRTIMKPATFDGTVTWSDYKAHFEACAELNGWSIQQKGLYLSVSLRGQAQGVFGNLTTESHDYAEIVKALEERFSPPGQTELYRVQLRDQRQKAAESMVELGQDVRRLTNLVYPMAPSEVRETLAKEQFVDALINPDMRLKIKQARPVDLNDAVRHAVELESFYRAEKRQLESQGIVRSSSTTPGTSEFTRLENDIRDMQKSVSELKDMFKTLKMERGDQPRKGPSSYVQNKRYNAHCSKVETQRRPSRKCFKCGSEKHLKRNCPTLQKKFMPKTDEPNRQHIAQQSVPQNAGLYVEARVNGHQLECLKGHRGNSNADLNQSLDND